MSGVLKVKVGGVWVPVSSLPSGGATNDVLTRDTTVVPFGAKWATPIAGAPVPSGGATGDVLTRDTTITTYGTKWQTPPRQVGRTTYTPTWFSTGTAPALGDGILTGVYWQDGPTVHFGIALTFGTVTTLGSGQYFFTLPGAAPVESVNSLTFSVSGVALDASAGNLAVLLCGFAGFQQGVGYFSVASTTGGGISSASPFAWASGDLIQLNGTYYTTA